MIGTFINENGMSLLRTVRWWPHGQPDAVAASALISARCVRSASFNLLPEFLIQAEKHLSLSLYIVKQTYTQIQHPATPLKNTCTQRACHMFLPFLITLARQQSRPSWMFNMMLILILILSGFVLNLNHLCPRLVRLKNLYSQICIFAWRYLRALIRFRVSGARLRDMLCRRRSSAWTFSGFTIQIQWSFYPTRHSDVCVCVSESTGVPVGKFRPVVWRGDEEIC